MNNETVAIRTIRDAVKEIKEKDPQTALTENALRTLVHSGEIPSRLSGKKYLLNLNDVLTYFSSSSINN